MQAIENSNRLYLIYGGEKDRARAAALNLIFDTHSLNFFPFEKLKDGNKLLFAGCGNGQLVIEIAKEANRRLLNVSIVAIDNNEAQLTCARQNEANERTIEMQVHHLAFEKIFPPIEWRFVDVEKNLKELEGQFNLVHTRFLLNNLSETAEKVTKGLCDTLLQEGIFIAEECSGLEVDILSDLEENTQAIEPWLKMVKCQHARQKSDIAFARRLPDILKNNQMVMINESKPYPRATSTKEKNLFPQSMLNAYDILPPEEHSTIPSAVKALETLRDSGACSVGFGHFTQIEAIKLV